MPGETIPRSTDRLPRADDENPNNPPEHTETEKSYPNTVDLPREVALAGARPFIPRPNRGFPCKSTAEVYKEASAQLERGLFDNRYRAECIPAFITLTGLLLMRHDVDLEIPNEEREENAYMIGPAGRAVIDAINHTPDGSLMRIDPTEVDEDLNRINSLQQVSNSLSWIPGVLHNNLARTEQRVGSNIRNGLKRIDSVLATDPQMRIILAPAINWVKTPARKALATRRDHERWTEEVRKDFQKDKDAEDKASKGGDAPKASGATPQDNSDPKKR